MHQGSFPPMPPAGGSGAQQPPQPAGRYGRALALWTAAYLLTWWFVITGAAGHNLGIYQLGLLALCGEGLYFFFQGRTGRALGGWWRTRSGGAKWGLGCLAVFVVLPVALLVLPFWPAVVLAGGIRGYYQATRQRPRQQLQATWQRVQHGPRSFQAGMATAVLIGACALFSVTGLVMASPNAGFLGSGTTQTVASGSGGDAAHTSGGNSGDTGSSGQQSQQQAATATTKPVPTATATPAPVPTDTPVPAPPPAPTCIPGAVNCNPWGYNFAPGNLIYNAPPGFCAYFNCIANFPNGRGYVIQCQDMTFSKSGGIQGSCSRHGGDLRPLYSH